MAFSRSSYTPMLEQTTEVLLFLHSPFRCRPWTHILLPLKLSRLALFPNASAIFAVRECCNWILICLKEIGQVISILHEPRLPCHSGRAGGWTSSSFSVSPHSMFLLSLLLQLVFNSTAIMFLIFGVFWWCLPFLCVMGLSLSVLFLFLSFLPFLRPLRIILAEDFYRKLKANWKPQEKQTKSLEIQTWKFRLI